MNGGAYGREVSDMLVECGVVLRSGEQVDIGRSTELGYTYRHSELPDQARSSIGATLSRHAGRARGDRRGDGPRSPSAARNRSRCAAAPAARPSRTRPAHKAWALIDAAGCRGLTIGGAQVSEKHCNFLLNLGSATSADIEALGEEVRRRVKDESDIEPRMGNPAGRSRE